MKRGWRTGSNSDNAIVGALWFRIGPLEEWFESTGGKKFGFVFQQLEVGSVDLYTKRCMRLLCRFWICIALYRISWKFFLIDETRAKCNLQSDGGRREGGCESVDFKRSSREQRVSWSGGALLYPGGWNTAGTGSFHSSFRETPKLRWLWWFLSTRSPM